LRRGEIKVRIDVRKRREAMIGERFIKQRITRRKRRRRAKYDKSGRRIRRIRRIKRIKQYRVMIN
jgi:YD repeat-containing protein